MPHAATHKGSTRSRHIRIYEILAMESEGNVVRDTDKDNTPDFTCALTAPIRR
jgi:hypothetical protein